MIGNRRAVKPNQIIRVETEAVRALRRGSNVVYLYRTTLHTDESSFRIGSGRHFRKFVTTVLPLIPDACLDVRSLELRDYFKDSASLNAFVRSMKLPRSDVLEIAAILKKENIRAKHTSAIDGEEKIKAEQFQALANQLRTSGRLLQALEAFRRALKMCATNGRLIYEFARCLQSVAASQKDPSLDRKAHAMLRLAERRSRGDHALLERLGEAYFSHGAWRRAEAVFRKLADSGPVSYRILRGLGELALRDGKC